MWTLRVKHKGAVTPVKVDPNGTWADVKERLRDALSVAPEEQKLLCRGKRVKDDGRVGASARDNARVMLIVSKKVAVAPNPKPRAEGEFKEKDLALYKGKERVVVLKAHYDDPDEVYYTIQRADGSERQTVPKYLSHLVVEPAETGLSAAPAGSKSVPEAAGKPPSGPHLVVKHAGRSLYIECDFKVDTLADIKARVAKAVSLPARVVRLVSGRIGRAATDSTQLSDTRLRPGSKLLLLFKEGFHIAKYGEEVVRGAIAEVEEGEKECMALEKGLEHRSIDVIQGFQRLASLRGKLEDLARTIAGVTVKKESERVVQALTKRVSQLRARAAALERRRREFG